MNRLSLGILCLLFCHCAAQEEVLNDDSQTTGGTLMIEHSFDSGKSFTPRGSITIHSLRSGSVTVQQNDLKQSEKDALQALCDAGNLYLLRIINSLSEGSTSFRSATDACNLINTGLADLFTIQLDWRQKLVSIFLSTPSLQNKVPLTTLSGFKSKVYIQNMESGPAPDTASFIQRLEEEKMAKQRGETKDNRSFFAKY